MSPAEGPARCTLHAALGRVESCPGAGCPFWGDENACVLLEIEFELVCRPPVAAHLLELRTSLEEARP